MNVCLALLVVSMMSGADSFATGEGKMEKDPTAQILMAICQGDVALLNDLIQQGAAVSSCALHFAAGKNSFELINVLVKAGASLTKKAGRDENTPLHSAVKTGQPEPVKALVIAGAPLHVTNKNGQTPIDLARLMKEQTEF